MPCSRPRAAATTATTASEEPAATATAEEGGNTESNTGEVSEFFVQEDYDTQLAQRDIEPEGDPSHAVDAGHRARDGLDTAKYKAKKASGWNICFSNAAVDNPWRQVGWTTMQEEVKLHKEIANFRAVDAEAKDDKQISDIEELANGNCDALIVSPNTTATLTPAVEAACEKVCRSSCSTAASTPTARSRSSTRSAATRSAWTAPSS